jgi:hypothetical protein
MSQLKKIRQGGMSYKWSVALKGSPIHYDYFSFNPSSVFRVDENFWYYKRYLKDGDFVMSVNPGKLNSIYILQKM